MKLDTQISLGKFVSPLTGKPLHLSGGFLRTSDGSESFGFVGSTPILVTDQTAAKEYASASKRMQNEYSTFGSQPTAPAWKTKWKNWLKGLFDIGYSKDYRTQESVTAFERVFNQSDVNKLYLSIGGGPTRQHPSFINLNIGPFPNVDIVADAHHLPYADGSVDAIYCEAVLEHLIDPTQAVQEMLRILKPGGIVFAATPFMSAYHGYPNHFQNFTLTGHQNLFTVNGFQLIESGVCVGPFCSLVDIVGVYILEYSRSATLGQSLFKIWRFFGLFIRKLDKHFNSHKHAFVLASSTYVVAKK